MPGPTNLSAALLAAGLAVPALLLLYFLKLRRKQTPISSTLLWRKAIEDLQVNAPFQKLRKNLLLFLQLLLLLLLCLALARPVRTAAAGLGKRAVLLIDHSASMNAKDADGQTRLDQAKRRAERLVNQMGSDSQAMVIAFADDAEVVQPFTSNRSALRNAIQAIGPTDRVTKFETAFKLANAQGMAADVWLFSDGCASDRAEATIHSALHDEKIGDTNTDNVGIVAMDARRNYDDPTLVQIFVRLANYGQEPVSPDVQLSVAPIDANKPLNWQVVRVTGTSLLPAFWTPQQREDAEKKLKLKPRDSVEFDLPMTEAAALKVQQMRTDALAADDSAQAIIPPPRQLRALLVTEGNYFLEKAIKSLNLRQPVIETPGRYVASWKSARENPSHYDVIIFDDFVPKQLPAVGNFIWFGAVPDGIGVTAEKKGNQFAHIQDSRFLDWQTDHPILRGLSLQNIQLRGTLALKVSSNAEVLAQGLRGPLIVLDRENQQTHLIVGFDLWQSDWPEHVSFPIFMRNAMQFMALGSQMNVEPAFEPGATPKIPRADLTKAGNVKQLDLSGPDGKQVVNVPASGDIVLPPLNRVGIYHLNPPFPNFNNIAVNLLNANESNLNPTDVAGGTASQTAVASSDRQRSDLWPWLIGLGALPLLLIEWWVYTRRVHM